MSLPLWTESQQKENKTPGILSLSQAMGQRIFRNKAYAWSVGLAYSIFKAFGIPENKMRLRQHWTDEKAFCADDAWDLEIELASFGWTEMCGVHDRTDYDLNKHAEYSKQKLTAKRLDHSEFTPHVLEIAFGIDRPFFALCDLSYEKREDDEQRINLRLPARLAPIQVAIFALMARDGLDTLARKIHDDLQKKFLTYYDESGSIGRRYSRMDSVGTPYCLTVDYESKEDHAVTLRERDTMKQERVKIADLADYLQKKLGAHA
jgi:glycyl-tRNA synthetase